MVAEHSEGTHELVGRGHLITEILSSITGSHYLGAMLVGEAGVGKTALARSVADALDGTVAVLPITASPSLHRVPFGALAPYLKSLSITDVGSSVAVYRSIMAHLETRRTDSSSLPLFLVDDSHELDDSTSVLLAQLVASRRAKILALSRSIPGPPTEFASLWQDGLLHRYDLGPLNPQEVHELCVTELGGEVLTSVSVSLSRTSGGNPMFLLALLRQGQRSGYLQARNGIWRL
ncbi:AAA family ATPase, partial [Arthrobacter sp. H5]|uniref:AAA family ATPase n=1 Tax=Arthrobacter sp. H5 TaxID=1267973 RepID=UPI00055C0425